MTALVIQNLRHILRSKLLIVLLIFSFLIQYVGIRFLQSVSIQFNQVMSPLSRENILFSALFCQIFTGAFLAAAYGIWMVPYEHNGPRSQLTYTLPISRWKFVASYAISMLFLLLFQHLTMIGCLALHMGGEFSSISTEAWRGFFAGLLFQTIAFEACMFLFAISSLLLGQMPTFFLGAFGVISLQMAAAFFHIDFSKFPGAPEVKFENARRIYRMFPPVGELVFDVQALFKNPGWVSHFGIWGAWLLFFSALLLWRLQMPPKARTTEN